MLRAEAAQARAAGGGIDVLVQEARVTGDGEPEPGERQAHGEHGAAVDGRGDVGVAARGEVLGHQVGRERDRRDDEQQRRFANITVRSTSRTLSKTVWWLTQMMPMIRKLRR